MILIYMYIAPGQGQTTPWGQTFDVSSNIVSLRSFVTSFKNISLKSDLIQIFMILYMHIAPGQGRQPLWDKILRSTEKPYHLAHLLQCI